MFSGITGAGLMLPWFLLAFPLLGVPTISIHEAIVSALFLETAAFSVGIYRYGRRRLIDTALVKAYAPWLLPAGVLGALFSHAIPESRCGWPMLR